MKVLRQGLVNWKTAVIFLIGVAVLVYLLYIDRHNQISHLIQSWGLLGVLFAILLMMVFCMTPIPSEGLLILYLRVYGVGWGILYAWFGSTLSMLLIYLVARFFGRPLLQKVVSEERFVRVNDWVIRRGSVGLLVARLLPIPAFVVNYAAGVIPAVGFWPYVWTGVISILPYYTGVALIYLGVFTNMIWIFVGLIPIVVVGFAGYFYNRSGRTSESTDGDR